jgi:outer membrane protein OmpA-like peptidoglycan-associated protein
VYFPQARSTTSTSGIAALARALGESGDVYVAGHTSVGEDAALGLQRAQWVIARLASAGVPSARLQAVGFGSHWGKSSTPPGMDEDAAERRVELHATWFGPPGCSPHPVPLDKCPIPCE